MYGATATPQLLEPMAKSPACAPEIAMLEKLIVSVPGL
jgi:hypothetical protein